jgi:hypothetical protein
VCGPVCESSYFSQHQQLVLSPRPGKQH